MKADVAATLWKFLRNLVRAAPPGTPQGEPGVAEPESGDAGAGLPREAEAGGEWLADVFEDQEPPKSDRPTGERLSKDTSYLPRPAGSMLKRSGDPALKYAQVGALLIRAIGEGNPEAFREALERAIHRAHAFKPIALRLEQIPGTVARIQKSILTKDYAYAAQVASTLAQDASLLTDDVVLMSTALIRMADSLEKAVGANDLMAASRQIQGLVTTAEQFDQAAFSRADQIMPLVGRLDRAVRTRDFALITSLAGILARDATIVSAFVHEDSAGPPPLADEPSLEEMTALIGELTTTRQFSALAMTARVLVYRAGLFADPVMAQALQLNQLSRQLRQALLEGKRDVALALSGNIARSAGIFRAPVLERTNHLLDQCLQLEQAAQHKDYAAISNLAARVARTADLLTNPQVARASQLVQQSTRLDQAIRRFDLQAASNTLEALPATR